MTVEETRMSDMNIFLQETESIDYSHPIITKQINLLKEKSTSNIGYINSYGFWFEIKIIENNSAPKIL